MSFAGRPWPAKPRLEGITREQCRAVHEASLALLERTGCVVPVAEARDLLASAGARVESETVRIPAATVEKALETVRPITLYDRTGRPALPLADGRVTFGALVDNLYVQAPGEPRPRPYLRTDLTWSARLLDALPEFEWLACSGQMHDVPPDLQTQVAFLGTVRGSTKPVLAYPYDAQGLFDIIEAAEVLAGGTTALRERPSLFCASVPSAPLVGADYNVELLLACAEREIPVLYHPHPAMGGNSPASLPGTLVLANADWLAGLAIHQLKRPGAPFCSAGFTALLMDMRSTLWSYCAPEMLAAHSAIAGLAHWYGMPAWGIEMLADAPVLNAQAGAELAATCACALLCNIELVHNAGLLGACKVSSAAASVFAAEQISQTRAALVPLDFDAGLLHEQLALIEDAGPRGDYITHPHTLAHFRSFWYPSVFDRSMFDPEAHGGDDRLAQHLDRRATELIGRPGERPLPEALDAELNALEASWYARLGLSVPT